MTKCVRLVKSISLEYKSSDELTMSCTIIIYENLKVKKDTHL